MEMVIKKNLENFVYIADILRRNLLYTVKLKVDPSKC